MFCFCFCFSFPSFLLSFLFFQPGLIQTGKFSQIIQSDKIHLFLKCTYSSMSFAMSNCHHIQDMEHFYCPKKFPWGFLDGAVVESLPANAGDTGSSPSLGRSHMPRSNWAHEPQLLSLHVWSLCSATREAAIVRGPRTAMKSGPHLPQLEKALAQKRRPNTAINK